MHRATGALPSPPRRFTHPGAPLSDTSSGPPRYYAVHLATRPEPGRATGWVWPQPFDSPAGANRANKGKLEIGAASLTFVVEVSGRTRRGMPGWTRPQWAKNVVERFLDLLDRLDDAPG